MTGRDVLQLANYILQDKLNDSIEFAEDCVRHSSQISKLLGMGNDAFNKTVDGYIYDFVQSRRDEIQKAYTTEKAKLVRKKKYPLTEDDEAELRASIIGRIMTPWMKLLTTSYNEADERDQHGQLISVTMIQQQCLARNFCAASWLANKQVVKFSKELNDDLVSAIDFDKGIVFNPEVLRRLPFTSICIDLEHSPTTINKGNLVTAIVSKVIEIEDGIMVIMMFVNPNSERRDWISSFHLTDSKCDGRGMYTLKPSISFDNFPYDTDPMKLIYLGISSLVYLSSEKPDVMENAQTKVTYKKRSNESSIKNKLSEVRSWDVGVRYAESLKAFSHRQANPETTRVYGYRTPVRPHVRRGHWHHYRTGKGRTNVIVKWLSETFVNAVEFESELPVVIHNE